MSGFVLHCRIPNGVILRLFEEVEGPFGVISHLVSDSVTLRFGDNDVDPSFFSQWIAANPDHDLVKNKFIERK